MGALDEISAAVAKVAGAAAPGCGRDRRALAPRIRRDRGRRTGCSPTPTTSTATGPRASSPTAGRRAASCSARTWTAIWPCSRWTPASAAALPWADAKSAPAIGAVVFAVASAAVRRRSDDGRAWCPGVARSFRGPGGRLIGGSIEHTAPLAPGSSGSPILDGSGRLLGINTQRIGEGFYLALPADEALRARIDALGRGESTVRPRLGIAVAPGHVARHLRRAVGLPDRDGILVRGVEEGSPAEAAGIREGDLIVSAGGVAGRRPRRPARGAGEGRRGHARRGPRSRGRGADGQGRPGGRSGRQARLRKAN